MQSYIFIIYKITMFGETSRLLESKGAWYYGYMSIVKQTVHKHNIYVIEQCTKFINSWLPPEPNR